MRIKSISTRDGNLIHEYFVNENDKVELVEKLKLDNSLTDKLGEYLKGKECVYISERKLLLINNLPFDITLIKEAEVKDLANSGYNTQIEAIGLTRGKKTSSKKNKK